MTLPVEASSVTGAGGSGWLSSVAEEARLFDRSSTAERVADILRRRVTEGQLLPGTRLSEEQLIEALGVSR
ncbi:MAG: GntR family transcriptional regulator, partial [Nocardioidaceae bacterium]